MLKTFNLKDYGKELEKIRVSLNLTRDDVSRSAYISKEALYKIEKGRGTPKYDSLEYLSICYKIDLLSLLLEYRTNNHIHEFNKKLDRLIAENSSDDFPELLESFHFIEEDTNLEEIILDPKKLDQYKMILSGLTLSFSDKREDSLGIYLEAMKVTIPTFNLDNWDQFKYDFLELRTLYLIGQGIFVNKNYPKCIDILTFCLKCLMDNDRYTTSINILIAKCYNSISYAAHMLDWDQKAYKYAQMGEIFCKSIHSYYALPNLIYRRGIAELKLGKNEYKSTLLTSIRMLSSLGYDSLMKTYIHVTKKMYGIDIINLAIEDLKSLENTI